MDAEMQLYAVQRAFELEQETAYHAMLDNYYLSMRAEKHAASARLNQVLYGAQVAAATAPAAAAAEPMVWQDPQQQQQQQLMAWHMQQQAHACGRHPLQLLAPANEPSDSMAWAAQPGALKRARGDGDGGDAARKQLRLH